MGETQSNGLRPISNKAYNEIKLQSLKRSDTATSTKKAQGGPRL
jgi:hypothetical protein